MNDPRAIEVARRSYLLGPMPANQDTYGWLLLQAKQAGKALVLLRQAAAAVPGQPQIQYHYAVALNESGHREDAIRVLTSVTGESADFEDKTAARQLLAELNAKP